MAGDVITDPDLIQKLEAGGDNAVISDPDLIQKLEDASTQPGMFANMPGAAKAIGTGLVKGVTYLGGMAGDTANMLAAGYNAAVKNLPPGWQPQTQPTAKPDMSNAETLKGYGHIPTSADLQQTIENAAGEKFYQPQGRLEQALETGSEFIPGALAGGGGDANAAVRLLKYGVAPGAAVGGVNALPTLDQHPYIKSGLDVGLGMLAPGVVQKFRAPNAATILSDPERMNQVADLTAAGVRLPAGDVTGLPQLRTDEQDLNPALRQQALHDFTQAATGRVGFPTENVTIGQQGNLPQAFKDVGDQYNQVASRNTWYPGFPQQAGQPGTHDPFYQELAGLYHTFHGPPGSTTPGLYSPASLDALDSALERVMNVVRPGAVSGADYQGLRSEFRQRAMAAQDPDVAEALHGVTNAMDNSFERSLQMQGSPDAGVMPQLNQQYRGLLTLQDARLKGGPATKGYITPPNLRTAAMKVYGKNAYMNGQTPFTDLGEAGSAILPAEADSRTAAHSNVNDRVNAISRGAGALIGSLIAPHLPGGEEAVLNLLRGEALGPMLNGVSRSLLTGARTSSPAQARLKSTWGAPNQRDMIVQALLRTPPTMHVPQPYASNPNAQGNAQQQ